MKKLTAFAAGVVFAAASATGASAQTKWDMPTPYGDGNFHTKNVVQFTQDVAKATGGKLTITVHSNGSLIKHPEIKSSIRRGVAPIGEVLISNHQNESPIYGVDSVPFLATSFDEAEKLWDAPIVTEVTAAPTFYPAEAYHQDYYRRNTSQGYCQIVIAPKVAKARKKFMAQLAG